MFKSVIAAAAAIAALLVELLFFPVLRALPEQVGMQDMLAMFAAMALLATVGIFVGAAAFNRSRARLGLLGFAVGELVLISVIVYVLSPWFYS